VAAPGSVFDYAQTDSNSKRKQFLVTLFGQPGGRNSVTLSTDPVTLNTDPVTLNTDLVTLSGVEVRAHYLVTPSGGEVPLRSG